MQSRFKKTTLVALTAIINNVLVTLYGLIYNKLIIVHYGSTITGLISTLTQFASMFTVIEGGFSLAVVVATYKPIIDEDYEELNNILYTAKKYFYNITVAYSGLVIACGVVYVYFLKSPLGFLYSLVLLGITTSTTALSIGGATKYSIVLSGDNKQYVTSVISLICKTITWLLSLVFIVRNHNIIVVYSLNVLNIILNIIFLKCYESKAYPHITYKGTYNLQKINGVKDIMFQKIASTIFTSTDLVLVSIGISLSKASVYYIYNQIFQGVFQYLSSLGNAPTDSFGQLLNSGEDESAREKFDIYKKSIVILSTIFLSVAAVMIIPFLKIYTRNVADENYIIPSLAVTFFTYNYLKLNNMPYGMIINVSGEFKKQNFQTGIAAIVNIVCSIVLMRFIGLTGIVLGSVVGTFVIISVNVFRTKEIISFNEKKDIFVLLTNFILGLILILLSEKYSVINAGSYIIWCIWAIIILTITTCLVLSFNYLLDRKIVKKCIKYYYCKFNKQKNK